MPSCSSMRSNPRFTSSRETVAEERFDVDLTLKPAVDEQRTCVRPFTPPNDEPVTRRPVMRSADDVERLALPGDADHRREPPRLARGLDGLLHDEHVAGRLEGVVGTEAARLGANPVDGVLGRDARVGGAVVAGALQASLREVDRDDPLGAGEPAADDGAEPDEPAPEDAHVEPGWTSAV